MKAVKAVKETPMGEGITRKICNNGKETIALPVVAWDAPVRTGILRSDKNRSLVGVGRSLFTTVNGQDVWLGEYAKDTSILLNSHLVETLDAALTSLGLTDFSRKINCWNLGREFSAVYTIPSIQFKGPDGQMHALQLRIDNSYNGSRKLQALIQALRLICLNGCVGTGTVFSLSQRHSSRIDVKSLSAVIAGKMESEAKMLADSFENLARIPLTIPQGNYVLRNMFRAAPLKFSGIMARKIETLWATPTADELNPTRESVFGLHTSGTRFFRDLEASGKLELTEKASRHFALALGSMAGNADFKARLLAPIEAEIAYSRATDE